jgi:hypothetical protein
MCRVSAFASTIRFRRSTPKRPAAAPTVSAWSRRWRRPTTCWARMYDFYGSDVIFLIAGGLYAHGPDLLESARTFRARVEGMG